MTVVKGGLDPEDHRAAKGWRPINFINCIGKLAEKVVAENLQERGYSTKASSEVSEGGRHWRP